MKYLRKLTAVLATLCLLATLYAPMMVQAETAPIPQPTAKAVAQPQANQELFCFGRSVLEQMDNSAALCYAYDKLVAGLTTFADRIDISHRTYKITSEEAYIVYYMALGDHPLYSSAVYMQGFTINGDYVIAFCPYYYDYDWDTYLTDMNHRVNELTAGLEGKSDTEKSVILHDRLCEAVRYEMVGFHQSAIGSLLEGKAVCAGYARGYQLLMQAVGIPCFYVTGTADNGYEVGGHAWNLVQLDGQWCYTDVTWDDTDYILDDGSHWILDMYLNITYDDIAGNHFAEEMPEYNFYLDDYLPKTPTPILYGDTDGNGKVNNRDLALLQQHLNGWDVAVDTTAADVDGNGKVNNRDLALLQQYLNGWDVTLK